MRPDAENVTIFLMMHRKKKPDSRKASRGFWLLMLLSMAGLRLFAQIPTQTWRTHFNYTDTRGLALVKDQVYCFTVNGCFLLDRKEGTLHLLGKEQGLSGGIITDLFYHTTSQKLIVAYEDGGIDLVTTDDKGRPVSVLFVDDFKSSALVPGNKSVRRIAAGAQYVYLSTANAVLVLDPVQAYLKEVIQQIGPGGSAIEINDIRSTTDSLYLLNSSGAILASSLAPGNNILFFGNWHYSANRQLFETGVAYPPEISPNYLNEALKDAQGVWWIADGREGLISNFSGVFKSYMPPGLPEFEGELKEDKGKVLFLAGKRYVFGNNRWTDYSGGAVTTIRTDDYGNEWAISGRGIIVRKGSASYAYSLSNGLPGAVLSFAIDKNQQVWMGTDNGVSVIQSSASATTSPRQPFNPVYGVQRLLIRELVPSIAVDQGNRKWIGTGKGIYLFNETGEERLLYFNEENSPMPDGQVKSVAMDETTGEVFIQTAGGLVSYQSDAAAPGADLSGVLVYPNPVKSDFGGVLTIDRLEEGTIVKITDVGGNLVYSTTSNGGKAVWDLLINGQKAQPGVYLVFCRATSGSAVSKFVIRP